MQSYDLTKVVCTYGGFRLGGFGEDGAIEFENAQPELEASEGADGQVVFNTTNSRLAYVNITLRETSRTHGHLHSLLLAQRAAPKLTGKAFTCVDTVTGESFSSATAVIVDKPQFSKGKTAGERVYRIALPDVVTGVPL